MADRRFQCNKCHLNFTRNQHLNTHMRFHLDEGDASFDFVDALFELYKDCTLCNYSTALQSDLNKHMQAHKYRAGCEKLICTYCGKEYSSTDALRYHIIKTHAQQDPKTCDHAGCGKQFSHKRDLDQHKKSHQMKKECHFCHKKYAARTIESHIRAKHGDNDDTFDNAAIPADAANVDNAPVQNEDEHTNAAANINNVYQGGQEEDSE